MKRIYGIALVWLLSVSPVWAQAITRLSSQPVTGTLATNGDVLTLPVPVGVGFGSIGVEARGTWTGTIEVQCAASTGGGSFVSLTLAPRNSTSIVTSFTANGQWSGSVAGCQRIQATATAAMTGTATVTLVGNFTSAFVPYAGVAGTATCLAFGGTDKLCASATALTGVVPYLGPDGSASAPSYSFANATGAGMYLVSANEIGLSASQNIRWVIGGTTQAQAGSGVFNLGTSVALGWPVGSPDVSLSREAAATLQQGVDAAGVTDQIFKGPDRITSDGVGGNLTIAGGRNRGASVGGSIIFQTSPAAGAGVTGTLATALTIDSTKLATFAGSITSVAGTTAIPPITVTHGTNLTTDTIDTIENDGTAFYQTTNTTNGRAYQDGWNWFRLTGSGSGITSIADFFGSNDGIPLVANGIYEIEWHAVFSQATAGTATWTIVTATTALASLTGDYMCSNIAGIGAVGAPQTAGINVTSTSSTAFPVTGSEANAATHQCTIKVVLQAGNGASNTRLRLTMSAGTATPLINSYFKVRQLPGGNIGKFVS